MSSIFAPLVNVTNQRLARCRRCRAALPRGQGQGWQFISAHITNSPVVYLCAECTEQQGREEKALKEAAVSMETVEKALMLAGPFTFIDRKMLEQAARKACEMAPQIAAEIAARVEMGESFNVYQVVQMFEDGVK